MMRLSAMWKVDATIDEETGSSPVAAQILERWAHDSDTLRFVRSSANFIYRYQEAGEQRFLRFVGVAERSRNAIEAELAMLQRLVAAGLSVAKAIPSRRDQLVETVETDRGVFHAVAFPALIGRQYDEVEELDTAGLRQWGGALGALHAVSSAFPDTLERPTWQERLAFIADNLPDDESLRREYEALSTELAMLPRTSATYGLIHGDFELDNLL